MNPLIVKGLKEFSINAKHIGIVFLLALAVQFLYLIHWVFGLVMFLFPIGSALLFILGGLGLIKLAHEGYKLYKLFVEENGEFNQLKFLAYLHEAFKKEKSEEQT